MAQEEWRPVVGFEGYYEVSDHGRVRSLDRNRKAPTGGDWVQPGRILCQTDGMKSRGDARLSVNLCRHGRCKTRFVHQLVLEAFVGPRPPGMQTLHWDDVKTNNHLSNLRWGTPQENQYDRIRNGNNDRVNQDSCKHGHKFTPENTYRPNPRHRKCRTCMRIRERSRIRDRRKVA